MGLNTFGKLNTRLLVILPILMLFFAASSSAKMYKYQDQDGRWHFTDKPPQEATQLEGIDSGKIEQSDANTTTGKDLAASLKTKYTSKRAEHIASIAVVEIKNALGHGSGFFFSDDGYIITNKHVVRPTETQEWDESQLTLAEQKKQFVAAEKALESQQAYHETIKDSLIEYEDAIADYWDPASKRVLEAEYKIVETNFYESERQLLNLEDNYYLAKDQFEKSKDDLFWKEGEASFATEFSIRIKDGTQLTAKLIGVSKNHDLALLKLQGYTTPFLTTASLNQGIQGKKVFAIGSPLGVSDSLTSGTVTRIDQKHIYTDSHILPGNSGGPLVDSDGNILGVITQKLHQGDVVSKGFGIAIPVNILNSEFTLMRAQGL